MSLFTMTRASSRESRTVIKSAPSMAQAKAHYRKRRLIILPNHHQLHKIRPYPAACFRGKHLDILAVHPSKDTSCIMEQQLEWRRILQASAWRSRIRSRVLLDRIISSSLHSMAMERERGRSRLARFLPRPKTSRSTAACCRGKLLQLLADPRSLDIWSIARQYLEC